MPRHNCPNSATTTESGDNQFLRAAKIAKRIGVCAKTITRMAERGQFPRYKIGNSIVLFNLREVEAAITAGRIDGSQLKPAA